MSTDSVFGASSGFMPGHTLLPGTVLRNYRIDQVVGEGGFGIVYLAFDLGLERRVAIKEYLPSSMAARAGAGMTVVVKSPALAGTFAVGLRSFINEARLLARFDHPALVKVHQFWEDHGTAYMVMPYYEGPTLKQVLADLGRPATEAEVRSWLVPLLDALEVLHAEQCFHRDVAPDNILITAGGPLLLDFGAARRVIGDLTHALTAVLKPGYAPIEQYGEMPGMGQGPWTDVFALASVLYLAIGGVRPVPAVERLIDDRLEPLTRLATGRCRPGFLAAIDHALALRPEHRPHSVAEFRALLDAADAAPIAAVGGAGGAPRHDGAASTDATTDIELDIDATRLDPAPRHRPVAADPSAATSAAPVAPVERAAAPPPPTLGAPATGPAWPSPPAASAAVPRPQAPTVAPALRVTPADVPAEAAPRRRMLVLAAAGLAIVVVGVGAVRMWSTRGERADASGNAAPSAATPSAAPTAWPAPAVVLPAPPPASLAGASAPTDPTQGASAPIDPPAAAARATDPPAEPPAAAAVPTTTAAPPEAAPRARDTPTAAPRARTTPSAPAPRPAPAPSPRERSPQIQARCSAILQESSLAPLTREQAEFLRRECR